MVTKNLDTFSSLHEKDTGSPEFQVSLLTRRILHLTEHFKIHKKDNHSKRGMMAMINLRKKMLKYLQVKSRSRYLHLLKHLDLRK